VTVVVRGSSCLLAAAGVHFRRKTTVMGPWRIGGGASPPRPPLDARLRAEAAPFWRPRIPTTADGTLGRLGVHCKNSAHFAKREDAHFAKRENAHFAEREDAHFAKREDARPAAEGHKNVKRSTLKAFLAAGRWNLEFVGIRSSAQRR